MILRALALLALLPLPVLAEGGDPGRAVLCAGRSGAAQALMELRQAGLPREDVLARLGPVGLGPDTLPLLDAVYLEPIHDRPAAALARATQFGRLVGDLCRAAG